MAAPQRRDTHLREIVARLQGMTGLFLGAMNDDLGYAFLRLGRAIERGDFAARVLLESLARIRDGSGDAHALHAAEWVGVLKSLTAYQMYRRSMRGPITRRGVVRFLAGSTAFPRALAHCAGEAGQALARLPASAPLAADAARLSTRLAELDGSGDADRLGGLISAAQQELAALHDAIASAYFAPPPPPPGGQRMSQIA
jgi:uncharacterized alpha-E superfamily protein